MKQFIEARGIRDGITQIIRDGITQIKQDKTIETCVEIIRMMDDEANNAKIRVNTTPEDL